MIRKELTAAPSTNQSSHQYGDPPILLAKKRNPTTIIARHRVTSNAASVVGPALASRFPTACKVDIRADRYLASCNIQDVSFRRCIPTLYGII